MGVNTPALPATWPLDPWVPSGTVAESFDRGGVGTTGQIFPGTGQLFLQGIPLSAGAVVSGAGYVTAGTASALLTNWWMVLVDASRNVLAVTADQGAAAIGANAFVQLTYGAPVTIQSTGIYYSGLMIAGGTMPNFQGFGLGGVVAQVNPKTCCTAGAGLTVPPAVGSQVAAFANFGFRHWCYLN